MPRIRERVTERREESVGCLSRIFVLGALGVQVVVAALGMLVLGMAGVLGNAAIISAEDALVIFVLLAANLLATIVLAVKLWTGSRKRNRLEAEIEAARRLPVASEQRPVA